VLTTANGAEPVAILELNICAVTTDAILALPPTNNESVFLFHVKVLSPPN